MKPILSILCIFYFFSNLALADDSYSLWEDSVHTAKLFGNGAVKQFRTKSNLYYLGASVPSLHWAFEEDERVKSLMLSKEIKKPVDLIGDLGVALSFPILPLSMWYYSKKKSDNHLRNFAMEYSATMYLALAESGLISFIQVHERPTSQNISFWEEAFRGNSSFPSGHVIPYMALTFKTYQFYGPLMALIPLGLTYGASLQRMQDGKHWVSDILGSFFLTAFASEGVRAANNYDKNHPYYKLVFEHDLRVGILRHKEAWGPRVSLSF